MMDKEIEQKLDKSLDFEEYVKDIDKEEVYFFDIFH